MARPRRDKPDNLKSRLRFLRTMAATNRLVSEKAREELAYLEGLYGADVDAEDQQRSASKRMPPEHRHAISVGMRKHNIHKGPSQAMKLLDQYKKELEQQESQYVVYQERLDLREQELNKARDAWQDADEARRERSLKVATIEARKVEDKLDQAKRQLSKALKSKESEDILRQLGERVDSLKEELRAKQRAQDASLPEKTLDKNENVAHVEYVRAKKEYDYARQDTDHCLDRINYLKDRIDLLEEERKKIEADNTHTPYAYLNQCRLLDKVTLQDIASALHSSITTARRLENGMVELSYHQMTRLTKIMPSFDPFVYLTLCGMLPPTYKEALNYAEATDIAEAVVEAIAQFIPDV